MNKKEKLALYGFGGLLALFGLLVAGFIGYLQWSVFENPQFSGPEIGQFLAQDKSIRYVQADQYEISIPIELVNRELSQRLKKQLKSEQLQPETVRVDYVKGTAEVNFKEGNAYLPIRYNLTKTNDSQALILHFQAVSFGKGRLKLPKFLVDIFYAQYYTKENLIQLNYADFCNPELFMIREIENDKKYLNVFLAYNTDYFRTDYQSIVGKIDRPYLEAYKTGTIAQKKIYDIVQTEDQSQAIEELIKAYYGQEEVVIDLLALLPAEEIRQTLQSVEYLSNLVDSNDAFLARGNLIGSQIRETATRVYNQIVRLIRAGEVLVCQEVPFDLMHMQALDAKNLNQWYDLELSEPEAERYQIKAVENNLYLLYDTQEMLYVGIDHDRFKIYDQERYQKDFPAHRLEPAELTLDKDRFRKINQAIEAYVGGKVYYRYLKNDSRQAFAIISPVEDYQSIEAIALERQQDTESYQLTADKIQSVKELNQRNGGFNLNLTTKMFEDPGLLRLNPKTKTNLIDGLKEKGYLSGDEELVYCSFDGTKYISIMLNSGEKYIYTIYRGTFLDKIYREEKALETFNDIPPIILLWPVPEI